MENYSVYEDIAGRTGGDIYIGVVGPVRTGKSTFIKRFMEQLVIPYAGEGSKAVMRDELPQSAAGRTVMTTEPKFVPAQAAKISVRDGAEASVRLVDCVGFAVEGAGGFEEDGEPRLIKTPWSDSPMPFEQAAALGTEKVIRDHSTIGILVTTDGSISDIPRAAYPEAEERAVAELKKIGKPFVILLNCKEPETAEALRSSLAEKYAAPVLAINVEKMTEEEIRNILQTVLFEFPVSGIDIRLPEWMRALSEENRYVREFLEKLRKEVASVSRMKDCLRFETLFSAGEDFVNPDNISMDLGKGKAELAFGVREGLFHEVLSEECGESIPDDFSLLGYVKALASSKKSYDSIREAFEEAEKSGYGTVPPTAGGMALDTPELVRKGTGFGVHFKATAPSYHIVRVDVTGEVNPIVGNRKQGEEFLGEILSEYDSAPEKVWETNLFGKSLKELLSDGLSEKAAGMSADVRAKMRRTITRIVNEGRGGVICILL